MGTRDRFYSSSWLYCVAKVYNSTVYCTTVAVSREECDGITAFRCLSRCEWSRTSPSPSPSPSPSIDRTKIVDVSPLLSVRLRPSPSLGHNESRATIYTRVARGPPSLLLLICVCVCVCFLPIHSGHQWTYQPGSHRRKVTQDFSSTFFLRCVP